MPGTVLITRNTRIRQAGSFFCGKLSPDSRWICSNLFILLLAPHLATTWVSPPHCHSPQSVCQSFAHHTYPCMLHATADKTAVDGTNKDPDILLFQLANPQKHLRGNIHIYPQFLVLTVAISGFLFLWNISNRSYFKSIQHLILQYLTYDFLDIRMVWKHCAYSRNQSLILISLSFRSYQMECNPVLRCWTASQLQDYKEKTTRNLQRAAFLARMLGR